MEIISWKLKHEENSTPNGSPGKSPHAKLKKENIKKGNENSD